MKSALTLWANLEAARDDSSMNLRDNGENRGSSEGRQTKGIERVEDGVDGRQARENETIDGVESRQAKVSEKMEDGGERRQARGIETRRLAWRGLEEYQKKPMEWACARQ